MKEFNLQKYKNNYNKTHYKNLSIRLHKEIYNKLEKKLKKKNLSKAQFLKKAIDDFLKND